MTILSINRGYYQPVMAKIKPKKQLNITKFSCSSTPKTRITLQKFISINIAGDSRFKIYVFGDSCFKLTHIQLSFNWLKCEIPGQSSRNLKIEGGKIEVKLILRVLYKSLPEFGLANKEIMGQQAQSLIPKIVPHRN